VHLLVFLEGSSVKRLLALLSVLFALVLAGPAGVLAQDGTPVPPTDEVVQFGEDTYAFVSSGYVSLFVVTDEGVIATDPSGQVDTERATRLEAAIAAITDQPVRYFIYAHSHPDHATGGDVFADTATVAGSARVDSAIARATLGAMVEGARIASQKLW
jgi:glyoxylase-like metal-dependent hydrolase (beta-lactamase superfamily II)